MLAAQECPEAGVLPSGEEGNVPDSIRKETCAAEVVQVYGETNVFTEL